MHTAVSSALLGVTVSLSLQVTFVVTLMLVASSMAKVTSCFKLEAPVVALACA